MKNFPDWRFNFSDEWKEKILGEIFTQTNETTIIDKNVELYSLTVENGITKKTERYNRDFLTKKEDFYKLVHPNEFVYNPMNMTLGAVGYNFTEKNIAVSGYYITMKTKQEYEDNFFLSWLKTSEAIKKFKLYATGTVKEKQRVQFPTFSNISVRVPSIDEQKKIAEYFSHLDKSISAQEKKLNSWRDMKKGLLQKIFSQEFRFADDNGNFYPDWQEKKLGEIISIPISNGVFCDPKKKGNGKKIINVIDLYNEFFIDENKLGYLDLNEKEFESNKVVSGDLFFTRSSLKLDGIGHCNIYFGDDENVIFDGHIMRVRVKDFFAYNKFIFFQSMTSKIRLQIMEKAKTTTMTTIGQEELSEIKFKLPCIEEQKKIAEYFSHLDKIISSEQKILENLRQMKKGLLQKLFV